MKASDVKFGVEIECYLPTGTVESIGGHYNGLQVSWLPEGWKAERDGSLTACPDGYRASEIVSPILAGEEGLCQVWYALETIKELHGIVNETCGLHVHVDARRLTADDVKKIRGAFVTYEKAFYGLNGTEAARRYNSHWCRRSDMWSADTDTVDRYRSLNLTNYYGRGTGKKTVEIRVWAGCLDETVVVTAVYMAVGLVVSAVNGTANGTGRRIENVVESAKKLVGSTVVNKDARIVDDCTVNEVTRVLLTACRKSGI